MQGGTTRRSSLPDPRPVPHPHRVMVIRSTRITLTPRARACHRSAARRPLRRPRSQLRAVQQRRRAGGTVPVRRDGRRDAFGSRAGRGVRVAGVPARRRDRGSATAIACTARGARRRAPAATPPSCCSTPTRARSRARCSWHPAVYGHAADDPNRADPRDSAPVCTALGAHRRGLRLGRRPPARTTDGRLDLLRGPRQGLHQAAPRACRTSCAAPTPGSRIPPRSPICSASASPRSSCCRCTSSSTTHSSCTRAAQLLGLSVDRLLRPAQRLRVAATAAARWTSFGAWSGHCTRPGSR